MEPTTNPKSEARSPKRQVEEQLSVPQIAERLGVEVSWVWRKLRRYKETDGREGIGPARKLGHRLTRVPASGVNRYLESREVVS